MDLQIIPECYIDTKLIKILVPPKTNYNHQKGCSTVAKVMQGRFTDDFALGIIDRDKQALGYADSFDLVVEVPSNIQLFKHRNKNHYLIFIRPAIEKWLLMCADSANVLPANFELPNDFIGFTKITKTSKSENEDQFSSNFKSFFKELKKQNPYQIEILSFWILYLKTNPYDADLNYIKQKTTAILNQNI